MKRIKEISYPEERLILSDILPYETPVTFSNRYFYKYLLKRKKCLRKPSYQEKECKAFKEIESILFTKCYHFIPFSFHINHKKEEFRSLSIIHPKKQLSVLEFYQKYKESIIYYCSISPFSIRKPVKVANHIYYDDMLHKKNNNGDLEHSMVEQENSEYENLKSFFTYKKYSNIHKFFESYQFHRSEKKFKRLMKMDITKCFDSIYTHSISWAVYNKDIIKQNIESSRETFPGVFDSLMQSLNASETNGIIIGPEFSRIFAEVILQRVDLNILLNLKKSYGLKHKLDYEIFRYVDDYFIFFNEENDADLIKKQISLCLKEYKLAVNDKKTVVFEKPIITPISIAKQKISDLFNEHLKLIEEENINGNLSLYYSSNNVITRFKVIIEESNVEYKDIMNYSLAVLDSKTGAIIKNFKKRIKKGEDINEKIFEKGFLEILDVSFFLYSVSPKVNSTIKMCLLLNKMMMFLKKNRQNSYLEPFSINTKHNVFKKISDEIYHILERNKIKEETQIESLYLLIALKQLGKEYRLSVDMVCSYFNLKNQKGNKIEISENTNYFTLTVLIFYIDNVKIYASIKDSVKNFLLKRFKHYSTTDWRNNTEAIILFLDILVCPYLNEITPLHLNEKIKNSSSKKSRKRYIRDKKRIKYDFKFKLLKYLKFEENNINLIEQEKFWFTKWTNFDFGMELQSKRSQEVY